MKIVVFVGLAAVVAALVLAGVFLYRDRGSGNRVMITLGIRVLLSASLVAFLVISYWLGWIGPTGLR
jgi:NADH:ubiquinone oxidoreductase subunit K